MGREGGEGGNVIVEVVVEAEVVVLMGVVVPWENYRTEAQLPPEKREKEKKVLVSWKRVDKK